MIYRPERCDRQRDRLTDGRKDIYGVFIELLDTAKHMLLCYDKILLMMNSHLFTLWFRVNTQNQVTHICVIIGSGNVLSPFRWIEIYVFSSKEMQLKTSSANIGHCVMMTSSNEDILPRYWPFVRGIHRSPHNDQWRGALMFLRSAPVQTVEQILGTSVIWGAIALIMTPL